MYRLIIKLSAELDATDAANWYNEIRSGLGDEFVLALDVKVSAIQRNPNSFPIIYKNIRRALTERFPYGIFFIVEDEDIYVLAIQHTSRNPQNWRKRK